MGPAGHSRLSGRLRLLAGAGFAIAPGLALVGTDVALRGRLLAAYSADAMTWYVATALVGAMGWGGLVVASSLSSRSSLSSASSLSSLSSPSSPSSPPGLSSGRAAVRRWAARLLPSLARAVLAVLAVLVVGTQLEAWARYGAYLNWRTALMGCSLWPCLAQELAGDRARTLGLLIAPALVGLGLAEGLRRIAPPTSRAALVGFVLGLAAFGCAATRGKPTAGWDSGGTPDVLWLDAAASLAKSMRTNDDIMVTLRWLPAARSPDALPELHAKPARARSVLLVLDESIRASDVCSVPAGRAGACDETPFTNALLPGRIGFTAMRSVDSTTALSIATLMTGLSPADRRDRLLSAPMLPEFAHTAGLDTALWTAQNLLFANTGRFLDGLPLSAFVSGTALAPYATYESGADDGRLLDRVLADVSRLRRPYLAIAQLSNTHFPYVVDPDDLPFSRRTDWRALDTFGQSRIRYRDAVHRQDKLLARFIATLRARPEGAETVIVFLSDHGEQLGERGHIGHTFSAHDEEIRVPLWIDAPPGTLSDREEAQLRALEDTPLTMLDVAPTILDLVGVWDDPGVAAARSRMTGVSLLRGPPPPGRAVVITNCSEIYSCADRNWGAMRGTRKLVGAEDEGGPWRCFDVARDPDERHDLGVAACGDLQGIAEGDGRGTPY